MISSRVSVSSATMPTLHTTCNVTHRARVLLLARVVLLLAVPALCLVAAVAGQLPRPAPRLPAVLPTLVTTALTRLLTSRLQTC